MDVEGKSAQVCRVDVRDSRGGSLLRAGDLRRCLSWRSAMKLRDVVLRLCITLQFFAI